MATDWFEWKDVKCTDLGVHVSEHPAITLPGERVNFTNVPGRSGSLTTLEGEEVYDDLLLTATCFIQDTEQLDEIAAYLKGAGRVTFANRQGGYYEARIINQIPFEKILRGNPHRSFSVNFRCKPFFYLEESSTVTLTRSGSTLTNPGAVHSEPVITVYGSGDITLMIGVNIVELTGVEESITLNTPLQEAYKGVVTQNGRMAGEFPTLTPGMNVVSWEGNVTRLVIQPNWRTL